MKGEQEMDEIDFIIDVEENGFDPVNEDHVAALQRMINSGLVWKLQGFWGRLASGMISADVVSAPGALILESEDNTEG